MPKTNPKRPYVKSGKYAKKSKNEAAKKVNGYPEMFDDGIPTFKLESGIPFVPRYTSRKHPQYDRVAKLVKAMKLNQSFVLPIDCKGVPKSVIKREGLNITVHRAFLPGRLFVRFFRIE